MEEQVLLRRMFTIAEEGGRIAMSLISDSAPRLKEDQSVLTKADQAISRLTQQVLADFLSGPEHLLIDEEDADNRRYFNQGLLERTPYLWSVDPIDGTRPFANRMPFFGISLGLLKNLKPHLGVVFFPMLGELFYADGEKAFFIEQAFSSREKKTEIVPADQRITAQSIFFLSDLFFKRHNWDYSLCPVMSPSCAVVDLCWPAIGRGCGCFFNANLWDFAGSWPVLTAAGLGLRNLYTGELLSSLSTGIFHGDEKKTWWLKDPYVVSSAQNFPVIQQNISAR